MVSVVGFDRPLDDLGLLLDVLRHVVADVVRGQVDRLVRAGLVFENADRGAFALSRRGPKEGVRGRTEAFDKVATRSYIDGMKAVGLKVLKNKLSEYVRLAEHGETIVITDRDRVVAEIVPPPSEPASLPDMRLADLVRKGYVAPARNLRDSVPKGHAIMKFEELMQGLEADRADRT